MHLLKGLKSCDTLSHFYLTYYVNFTVAGHLVTCVNDTKILLMRHLSAKEDGHFADKKRLLVSLMEPTIEYIMKCIFENTSQSQVSIWFLW